MRRIILISLLLATLSSPVAAQTPDLDALQAQVTQLQLTVQALQQQVATLQNQIASMGQPVSQRGPSLDVASIYAQAAPSVVEIFAVYANGAISQGSGVVSYRESNSAQVTTNRHVVAGADMIFVAAADGRPFTATLWAEDPELDYADLKITGPDLPPAIPWGDPDAVRIGDPVVLIGSPRDNRNSVSAGVLSARSYLRDNNGYEYLQTDAAASHGSSGGPMLDSHGRWIGMVTEKDTSKSSEGLTFAISLKAIRTSIEISNRPNQARAYLGAVLEQNPFVLVGTPGNFGVTVRFLDSLGPLSKAQVQIGDTIEMVNRQPVNTLADARRLVDTLTPGTTIPVTVKRGSSTFDVRVTLGTAAYGQSKPSDAFASLLKTEDGCF